MAQTDNSFIADKIALRCNHLPDKETITVLDCFGGKGVIWKGCVTKSDKKIRRLAIDTRKDEISFHLPGSNMAYLDTLDLSKFDAIDLDAYGVPYEQLKSLFRRGYKGAVFVTFIQSVFGAIPDGLLIDIGIPADMVNRCPSLFYGTGWEFFLDWLALNGVRTIYHRSHDRKHYLYFSGAGLFFLD